MRLGVFGSAAAPGGGGLKVVAAAQAGVFAEWKVAVPALRLQASVTQVKTAGASKPWEYGPELSWRKTRVPMAPDDADFAGAAEWRVEVPAIPAKSAVADLFLEVRYSGDVARLYAGNELVDDDFWNGVPWTVGLRETGAAWKLRPSEFRLEVLPLPKSYPMYIEQASQLVFARDRTTPAAPEVRLIPQYRVELQAPAH
jgi:hypothetical protein